MLYCFRVWDGLYACLALIRGRSTSLRVDVANCINGITLDSRPEGTTYGALAYYTTLQ
jgi:hypothetical protein